MKINLIDVRNRIEDENISPYEIGDVIYNHVLQREATKEELRTVLDIVWCKLQRLNSDKTNIKRKIDNCKTPRELTDLTMKMNFGEYYAKGVNVSEMVSNRYREIFESERRSGFNRLTSFFKRVFKRDSKV